MAPHGPAGRCARRRSEPLDQVTGRIVDECTDPVGAGAVQGGVDLGENNVELLALGGRSSDRVLTLLLVLGQGGQTLPQVALGAGRLLGLDFGGGKLCLGGDDRLTVGAAQRRPRRLGARARLSARALRPDGAG